MQKSRLELKRKSIPSLRLSMCASETLSTSAGMMSCVGVHADDTLGQNERGRAGELRRRRVIQRPSSSAVLTSHYAVCQVIVSQLQHRDSGAPPVLLVHGLAAVLGSTRMREWRQ